MNGRKWLLSFLAVGLVLQAGCLNSSRRSEDLIAPLASGAPPKEKELPPDESAKLCLNMAEAMERSGHDMEAAMEFEKARQYDPKLKVARRLGMIYERLGEFRLAQAEYEKALQENPKDPVVYNDLGYMHYRRGRFDEAETNLRQAVALNPKYARAWINLGLTLGQKGNFDASLAAFEKAVSPAEAYSNLAFVYLSLGKREEAKQAYREALKREPDLRVARANLAKLERPMTDPAVSPARHTEPTARAQSESSRQLADASLTPPWQK